MSFEWESPDGVTHKGAGYTRDISAASVFIVGPEPVPVGSLISLVVSLPSLQDESSGAQLRTLGHLVRTDRDGFAVIAEMGFRMKFFETQTLSVCGAGRHDESSSRGQEGLAPEARQK